MAEKATPRTNVFVVDDDIGIRRSTTRLLEVNQYAVESFQSCGEFLDKLNVPTPGCVLLDVDLPGESGLETCQTLRDTAPHMPVIMFTGNRAVQTHYEAMKYGAVAFLEKPSAPNTLLNTIAAAHRLAEDRWTAFRFQQTVATLDEPGRSIIRMTSNDLSKADACRVLGMSHARMDSQIALVLATLGVASLEEAHEMLDGLRPGPISRAKVPSPVAVPCLSECH